MRLKRGVIVLFLLPAIIIYLGIFLYPTIRTVMMSFYNIPSLSSRMYEWKWVGFQNYFDLMHNSYFISSVLNVLKIWIFGGAFIFFLAFFYAVLLTSGIRGKSFWRSLIYLPNTVSAVVLSVVWLQYIFNSSFGFLTNFFKFFRLNSLANIQWTSNELIFTSMIIAFTFGSVGYFMLILLAGIERIPYDFYEASTLEGANVLQKFFMITLPLLRDVFKTSLVLWTVTAMNFFVWSATFGLDDPHTITPGYYMYRNIFGSTSRVNSLESLNVGAGAVVGILITLSIIVLAFIINRFFKKDTLEF
jgi:ABC-type sugar transport system permease subunit